MGDGALRRKGAPSISEYYTDIKFISTRLWDDLTWGSDWNAPFRPGYSTKHEVNNGYIYGLNTGFCPNNNTKIEIWGRLGRPYNNATSTATYDYRYQMLFGAVGTSGEWADNNSFDYYLTRGTATSNNASMPYFRFGSTKVGTSVTASNTPWYTNGRGGAYVPYAKGTTVDSSANPDTLNLNSCYFKLVCNKNVWTYTLWGRAIDWEDASAAAINDLFSDTAVQGTYYCTYKKSTTLTANTFQCDGPLYLLHDPRDLASTSPATITSFRVPAVELYGCKIYDNGVLVRDYIPVRNNSGIAGLLDKVNYTFITDPNIKGPGMDLNPNYTNNRVIPIEAVWFNPATTGTNIQNCPILHLPYKMTPNTELDIKFQLLRVQSQLRLFIASGSSISVPSAVTPDTNITVQNHASYGIYLDSSNRWYIYWRALTLNSSYYYGWSYIPNASSGNATARTPGLNKIYEFKFNDTYNANASTIPHGSATAAQITYYINFRAHNLASGDKAYDDYYLGDSSHHYNGHISRTGTGANNSTAGMGYSKGGAAGAYLGYDDGGNPITNDDGSPVGNSSGDLYIGGNNADVGRSLSGYVYAIKIYEHVNVSTKNLIYDLVPVQIDGVTGFYDIVNNNFYTSDHTRQFEPIYYSYISMRIALNGNYFLSSDLENAPLGSFLNKKSECYDVVLPLTKIITDTNMSSDEIYYEDMEEDPAGRVGFNDYGDGYISNPNIMDYVELLPRWYAGAETLKVYLKHNAYLEYKVNVDPNDDTDRVISMDSMIKIGNRNDGLLKPDEYDSILSQWVTARFYLKDRYNLGTYTFTRMDRTNIVAFSNEGTSNIGESVGEIYSEYYIPARQVLVSNMSDLRYIGKGCFFDSPNIIGYPIGNNNYVYTGYNNAMYIGIGLYDGSFADLPFSRTLFKFGALVNHFGEDAFAANRIDVGNEVNYPGNRIFDLSYATTFGTCVSTGAAFGTSTIKGSVSILILPTMTTAQFRNVLTSLLDSSTYIHTLCIDISDASQASQYISGGDINTFGIVSLVLGVHTTYIPVIAGTQNLKYIHINAATMTLANQCFMRNYELLNIVFYHDDIAPADVDTTNVNELFTSPAADADNEGKYDTFWKKTVGNTTYYYKNSLRPGATPPPIEFRFVFFSNTSTSSEAEALRTNWANKLYPLVSSKSSMTVDEFKNYVIVNYFEPM